LGEAQTSSSLAGTPFLDTPAQPENTSSARSAREAGESSTMGDLGAQSRLPLLLLLPLELRGGSAKAAVALVLALRRLPSGVFLCGGALFYSYYGVVVAVALLGALEVSVGFWAWFTKPSVTGPV